MSISSDFLLLAPRGRLHVARNTLLFTELPTATTDRCQFTLTTHYIRSSSRAS